MRWNLKEVGSKGIDGMKVDELRTFIIDNWLTIKANLLEGKLKLKVNVNKSAVDIVSRRKFLGLSFYFSKDGAEIRIHEKSYKRFKEKIREITN